MTIAKHPKRLITEERLAGAFISGASKEKEQQETHSSALCPRDD